MLSVTVITVVFNAKNLIEDTIKSVIAQSYNNIEYIIIDGGSIDGTISIIKKYENKVQCWLSEKDSGIYDAMNKGISLSKSDWVLFLNAGDCFTSSDSIRNCIGYIDSDSMIIYSDTMLYRTNKGKKFYRKLFCNHYRRQIIHQSCLYNKKLHAIYGQYIVNTKVTISDYLFFNLIDDKYWKKTDHIISSYLVDANISSGTPHFLQILAVDLIFSPIPSFRLFIRFLINICKYYIKKLLFNVFSNSIYIDKIERFKSDPALEWF